MHNVAKRVDDHVGACVRARRTELGLTQEDLAAALGLSYQQVQKYETGANRISAGRLYHIARRLDVEVSYFFTGAEADDEADLSSQRMAHGGTKRVTIETVRNFEEIPDPAVRSAISGLIKSLADPEGNPQATDRR